MRKNVVKDKSFEFALLVVQTYKLLANEQKEFVLSKQFLRSGTAIGALIREAEQAESKADFIHKLAISLKEANETDYWIELIYQSDYLDESWYQTLSLKVNELIKLLIAIIKSGKKPNGE